MAELLKFIQARLTKPVVVEAEETPRSSDSPPPARDDDPQLIQHPHITNMQQWLDLNA